MSVLFRSRALGDTQAELVPRRDTRRGVASRVTPDTALNMSAVWAALRLRADLISTLPVDVFRRYGSLQLEAPKPPFLADPGGDGYGWPDWMFSSQYDLDRYGNTVGLITARDGNGLPRVVELQPMSTVTAKGKGPTITEWRIRGKRYDPSEVWHERQYTVPGVPLGLSPILHAAMTIGAYQSAEEFAADWFTAGGVPGAILRNRAKTLTPTESDKAKRRFKATIDSRDVFVTGADWEYTPVSIDVAGQQFLDLMRFGTVDACRFIGVPADLIDAPMESSAKITYANIQQRHLQVLVLNLGPAIVRREAKLSSALAAPRFVRLDSDEFLRMDPETRERLLIAQVAGRTRAPSEARATANLEPYTPDQVAEFATLFPMGPGVTITPTTITPTPITEAPA